MLIFEVTVRQILYLPSTFQNQQSAIINHQSIPSRQAAPRGLQQALVKLLLSMLEDHQSGRRI